MEKKFEDRKYVIGIIFILIGIIFIIRLFFLQVVDTKYKLSAENNVLRYETEYPARGLIFDRNGKLLVYNEAAYDLMVIPRQIKDIDTVALAKLLDLSLKSVREKLQKARRYSTYKSSIFLKQIPGEQFGAIQEKLFQFPGFFVQTRTLRKYPEAIAGHILGYVGEVNRQIINKDSYYHSGDYYGVSGLEKYYEKELRGKKGVSIYLVDVHNRKQGRFKEGAFDTVPEVGVNLKTTIDANLQLYGEQLMQNKKGSIVAIEPSTGEILSMVSAPTYNPNLLVGRIRNRNFSKLSKDTLKPLFNRALMAKYPPGSIFKILQALIALDTGLIKENTGFSCEKFLVNCHNHPEANSVAEAVQYSCNPYFYKVFQRILLQGEGSVFSRSAKNLDIWKKQVLKFGFGKKLHLDQPGIKSGYIPGKDFYDRWYGEGRWAFSTIYSLSIGQGELQIIPLQMANFAAIIANRGSYIEPHFVKEIGGKKNDNELYLTPIETGIDKKYYDLVIEGMDAVVNKTHGTARRARLDTITICGKTGTAENPHGEDHSVFIAFAPKENPKIAIAVYVENSGFGGTWAAPIASLMIEKYLMGTVESKKREERILNANLLIQDKIE